MWPFSEMSLGTASLVSTIANWLLLASLVGGVLSTFAIVKSSDVKEEHWAEDRRISNERIAGLNNDTARLQADNLALQTVLLPRHVGIIGVNERPKAETWFAGMAAFAGVPIVIQPTDDNEARNLAAEITIALAFVGVRASVDENATGLKPSQFSEGVSVAYATGKPWTKEAPNQPWFEWAKAANMLADALTKAGLGVGEAPVQRYGFIPAEDPATVNFRTIREGVLVYVGQRPVSHTIAWIKQGRPDAAGNRPADAAPAEPHK
jgi:hypothetical protein